MGGGAHQIGIRKGEGPLPRPVILPGIFDGGGSEGMAREAA